MNHTHISNSHGFSLKCSTCGDINVTFGQQLKPLEAERRQLIETALAGAIHGIAKMIMPALTHTNQGIISRVILFSGEFETPLLQAFSVMPLLDPRVLSHHPASLRRFPSHQGIQFTCTCMEFDWTWDISRGKPRQDDINHLVRIFHYFGPLTYAMVSQQKEVQGIGIHQVLYILKIMQDMAEKVGFQFGDVLEQGLEAANKLLSLVNLENAP